VAATRTITVLVLVFSLGLHWAFLQAVAWTGMLISYSQEGSFGEAVQKTFDGEHPCPLCKAIEKGRAEEKEQAGKHQVKPGAKLDPCLVWDSAGFLFVSVKEFPDFLEGSLESHLEGPPKPRPRRDSAHAVKA